jgi:hypothetical protein
LTVNSGKLDFFFTLVRVEVEQGHPPFSLVFIPMRFRFDLLEFLIRYGNLNNVVSELEVFFVLSYSIKQVLLIELILPLKVLYFNLSCLIPLSKSLCYISQLINFLLKTLVLLLNQ